MTPRAETIFVGEGGAVVAVYEVVGRIDDYQELVCHDHADCGRMRSYPRSMREGWVPPRVYVPVVNLPAPDIWRLSQSNHLVFNQRAVELLDTILHKSGELLPLPYHDETLWLLNIVDLVNCLDPDATEWLRDLRRLPVSGIAGTPTKLAFHANRLPEALFKIPETLVRVYCTEGLQGPYDEFTSAVELHELTGVRFRLKWNSAQLPQTPSRRGFGDIDGAS